MKSKNFKNIEIPLDNCQELCRKVYKLDSVNLILGEEKTLFINHFLDGAIQEDKQGILYYSTLEINNGYSNSLNNAVLNITNLGDSEWDDWHDSSNRYIQRQSKKIQYGIDSLIKDGKYDIAIFIDDCDAFLDLEMQSKYISDYTKDKESSIKLILGTNSIFLPMDVFKENILSLSYENGEFIKNMGVVGFGASIQDIIQYTYGSKNLGAISSNVISGFCEKRNDNKPFTSEDIEIAEKIDNKMLKDYLGLPSNNKRKPSF